MKPRLRAEELTGMISLLRDKFVRSENLRRCCFVPMRKNSIFDGLKQFVHPGENVIERNRAEFVGVKKRDTCRAGCHQRTNDI